MQVWVSPFYSLCNYFFTQLTLINLPPASTHGERACTPGSLSRAKQVAPTISRFSRVGGAGLSQAQLCFWSWLWGFRLAFHFSAVSPPRSKTAASCPHQGHSALGLQWAKTGSHMSSMTQTLKPLVRGHGCPPTPVVNLDGWDCSGDPRSLRYCGRDSRVPGLRSRGRVSPWWSYSLSPSLWPPPSAVGLTPRGSQGKELKEWG